MHVAIMSCCNPCAGRPGWLARGAGGGGGQLWGGRGGGKQQTNSFSFVVEGWLLQTPWCVQSGQTQCESQALRLLLPVGFLAFCALLGLAERVGNSETLLCKMRPGLPFAVLATVWFKRSRILGCLVGFWREGSTGRWSFLFSMAPVLLLKPSMGIFFRTPRFALISSDPDPWARLLLGDSCQH